MMMFLVGLFAGSTFGFVAAAILAAGELSDYYLANKSIFMIIKNHRRVRDESKT